MDDKTTPARKHAAVQFLQMVVAGDIEEAYRKYVDMKGKHHNFFFPAGFPALQKAMIENHDQFPNKQLLVKNFLEDGDLVAVHSRLILDEAENDMAVFHLFRFKDNRIVEMWDIGNTIPEDSPNTDGAF
jgi:predicted SnoaL-like aldol condensation-catalyzing enzyme